MAQNLHFGLSLEPDLKGLEKSWKEQEKKIQDILDKKTFKINIQSEGLDAVEEQLKRIQKLYEQTGTRQLTAYQAAKVANQANVAAAKESVKWEAKSAVTEQQVRTEIEKTNAAHALAEQRQLRLVQAQEKSVSTIRKQTEAYRSQTSALVSIKGFVSQYVGLLGAYRLVSNIKEITSEFELQRVALRAITQDAQFAGDLMSKIQASAVESPFSVKDMLTYTKQLAAYRVENEKLYETMNMLADVSAGLGVDMSRLILAYGQVKAAAVLRGTELRQFTEAGIPLVDELAKKFTKLRGEVVSTGEVFELISKRAVPFEMISEIFEDMTEEGGRFYQMQEKQAKSLYGVYENLTDKIQISMDKIGQTNRGMFMSVGQALGYLAENLDSITNTLGIAIPVFAAYKIAMWGLKKYYGDIAAAALAASSASNAFTRASIVATGAIKGISAAIKSIPVIGWILAGVSALVTGLDMLTKKQREFNASLKETLTDLTASINGIHGYVSELKDLNEREKEQKATVDELTKAQSLSLEQKEKLSGANTELASIQERRVEVLKQLSSVDEVFARNIKSEITDTEALTRAESEYVAQLRIRYALEKGMGENKIAADAEKYNEADTKQMQEQSDFLLKMGDIYDEVNRQLRENSNLTKEQTDALTKFLNSEKPFIEAYKELMEDLPRTFGHTGYRNISDNLYDIRKELDNKDFYKYEESLRKTQRALEKFEKDAEKTIRDLTRHADVSEALKQISSNDVSPDVKRRLKNQVIDTFSQAFDSQGIAGVARQAMQKVFERITGLKWGKEADIKTLLPWQEDLQKLTALDFTSNENASQATFFSTIDEIKKKYKELMDERENLSRLTDEQRSVNGLASSYEMLGTQMSEIETFANKYNIDLVGKGNKDAINDAIKALENEYSLVTEIDKRFKELRKDMSDGDAADAISEIYGKLTKIDFLSPDGLKKRLQELKKDAERLGDTKLAIKIGLAIQDVDFNSLKKDLQDKLNALAKSITQQQTGVNFFEKLLGITGDTDLSTKLTVTVTGVDITGADVKGKMQEQIAQILSSQSIAPEVQAKLNLSRGAEEGESEYISRIKQMIADSKISVQQLNDLIASIKDNDLQSSLESALKSYVDYNSGLLESFLQTVSKVGNADIQKAILGAQKGQKEASIANLVKPENVDPQQWANWIKAYMDAIGNEYNAGIARINFDELKKKFSDAITNLDAASVDVLTKIIEQLQIIAATPGIDANTLNSINELVTRASNIKINKTPLKSFKEGWDEVATAASKATKEEQDAAKAADLSKMKKALQDMQSQWGEVEGAMNDIISLATQIADAFGVTFDEGTQDAMEGFATGLAIVTTALSIMTAAAAVAETVMWPLLVIALAVGRAFAVITWLSGMKERKANKEIERLEGNLRNLQRAYEDIERAQEKYVGSDWIKAQNQKVEVLKKEIANLQEKMYRERSKGKKTDESVIEDLEDKIREAQSEIQDLQDDITKEMSGTDLTSAAVEFAEAWLDAYLEFADTTDAIKEKFLDMMKSMVTNSVLARVVQRKLQPLFDYIDKSLYDNDGNMVGSLERVWQMMQKVTEELPTELEAVYNSLGTWAQNLRSSEGQLTGIAKGVSTASEESVVTLAGYANSILFYHVKEAGDLEAIRAILEGKMAISTDVSKSDSAGVNIGQLLELQQQTLAQVIAIKEDTTNIRSDIRDLRDSFRSVLATGSNNSPKTINVKLRN